MADKKISIIVEALVAAARRNLKGVNKDLNDLGRGADSLAGRLRAQGTTAEDAGLALGQLGYSAGEVKQALKDAGYEAESAGSSFDLMGAATSAVATSLGLLVAGFAMLKLGQKALDIAETAAAAERLAKGFDILAARSQVDSELLLSALKEASRGTISEYDLMAQANKAWYLGVAKNVKQYADLMKIAEVKSKDLGISTVQYWERLTAAVASGYPITMRQLGIVIDNKQAYEDWAITLGKTTDELTDQEKVQARVNAVIADGEPTLRRWEEAERDAITVTQDFRAATADLALEIKKNLLPVLIPAIDYITKGLRGIEAGMEGQNIEMARLIELTGSAAEAEKEFAKNIMVASGGLIDGAEAARLASVAMLDYKIALIGIDKGIQEDIIAMRMAEQATIDWSDVTDEAAQDTEDLAKALNKARDAHDKYARDVEQANYRFGKSVADANFRATQAAEKAAFRRYEIERDAGQRIADAFRRAEEDRGDYARRFQTWHSFELAAHINKIQRQWQDLYDDLADMEWDYQEDRRDLLKRAPWWIRQALQKEFAERKRIAATGDTKALRDYDRALRERIRAIDPIYAQELDELQEQYDQKRSIEEREAEKARDRTEEDWELRLREQKASLEEQFRKLERGLREQTRVAERELRDQLEAWRFHDRQRHENEARAMERLRQEHAHQLAMLQNALNHKLSEINRDFGHWGWTHGTSYVTKLNEALAAMDPSVAAALGRGAFMPSLPSFQRGIDYVPSAMPALLHKGEMVVPAAPAEQIREGGLTVTIENLTIGPGASAMNMRQLAEEMGVELGRGIRQGYR